MFLRWKRRAHATSLQRTQTLCAHDSPAVTLTPVLLRSVRGPKGPRHETVWRPGGGIRECCLDNVHARAAWWAEVAVRIDALNAGDELPPDEAFLVLQKGSWLVEELAKVVRIPTERQHAEFVRRYGGPPRRPRRRTSPARIAPEDPFAILGLPPDCSEDQFRTTWRELVFTKHPDRGGDHESFVRLTVARDACRQALRARETNAP